MRARPPVVAPLEVGRRDPSAGQLRASERTRVRARHGVVCRRRCLPRHGAGPLMARIRSVKPEFWTDEKVAELSRDARLTFLGLISALADDDGRMKGNPRVVRGMIYPFDEDVTAADIEAHLEEIDQLGL